MDFSLSGMQGLQFHSYWLFLGLLEVLHLLMLFYIDLLHVFFCIFNLFMMIYCFTIFNFIFSKLPSKYLCEEAEFKYLNFKRQ